MAVKGTIQFKDGEGNDLKGPREDGSSLILDFSFGVTLPFDAQGKIQGQRSVMPFTITKEIDQLTPQLAQIICTAARCSMITVFLFRIEPETGLEKNYFIYVFEDAHIVQQANSMPSITNKDNEHVGHLESISFVAKRVTWLFKEGNIQFMDEPALHFTEG
ncbi:MAG: type VI secretion system tube protein TssD [Ignavibacteria bacterium]